MIMRFYQLNHFILASTSTETQNAALKKKVNKPTKLSLFGAYRALACNFGGVI